MADDTHLDAHMRNADAFVLQGQMAQDKEAREDLYAQAFDLYVRVESKRPGHAAWKLACVAGYRGNANIAKLWLKRAVKFDGMPDIETAEAHYAFERFRGQKWFKSIFTELKRKAKS